MSSWQTSRSFKAVSGVFSLKLLFSLLVVVTTLSSQARAVIHASPDPGVLVKPLAGRNHDGTNTSLPTNSSSEAFVAEAHSRIAIANKMRLDNPRFNTNEFPPENLEFNSTLPPIISKRGLWRRDNASIPIDYSIPDELAEAAREVAESRIHPLAVELYSGRAAALKAQSWTETEHDGTLIFPQEDGDALAKRQGTGSFWMESMNMNGKAPFAGAGYKVFRNVKDYGAVGDGIHDDTAAINNAVADGSRCGLSCGSSTAKPAVIYFPSGTYLISTPIVQLYNTQFLGDPINRPIILGASSFSGMGVFSSNVYIDGGDGAQWYIPQSNFLRSIRNFIFDITNTPEDDYVCAIHWQVAQATDLTNLDFYMKPGTTQQGIFMENGSGGMLSNLYFYGGNFGAYLGNQQFTSRNLIFDNCLTALQIHWDWAWTMQAVTIVGRGTSPGNPSTGITIVGGAGGPGSTGQGVGSFILLDSTLSQLTVGISTTLVAENSTSLLLQNVEMTNVGVAIRDVAQNSNLMAGGASVNIPSWGFGRIVTGESGASSFQNGNSIATANRSASLTVGPKGNYFTRPAPTYQNLPIGSFINVISFGAKGDGVADDTSIINSVLALAASSNQVVFFPYGMYMVRDTIQVPLGSRIVGQAWPQIVGNGVRFQDMLNPRPVVRVGRPGDVGSIEITDMMVSVKGKTAGAVLMEWNVHEQTQGSAAAWNTHFRVGGNIGSSLQVADCPKLTGLVDPDCIAASMLLHLTQTSSAYLENVWAWVADHDLDILAQTQIDIYSGRGILVESQGPSWLWATSSEHNVLYQYELLNARDIFLSMIQTETPYFQPAPKAPAPFIPGVFPEDPDFSSCSAGSTTCASSWALRIIDSSNIFMYSSGLYSWFNEYSQACVATENCQDRGVEIENSSGVWIYALATKAIIEMVSPVNVAATLASVNQNGFLSSILAWLRGSTGVVGSRFEGWPLFPNGSLADADLTPACEAALYQTVKCDTAARVLVSEGYQGNIGNTTKLARICDAACADSLRYLRTSIASACVSTPDLGPGFPLVGFVDFIWSHWNETCFKDPSTNQFCDTVISDFTPVNDISEMPPSEMCSYCHLEKYRLMHESAYSFYDNATVKEAYEYIANGLGWDLPPIEALCPSGVYYTTVSGDTCDSISTDKGVSSLTLFWINPDLRSCTSIPAGSELCLPLPCDLHTLEESDTCVSIAAENGILAQDLYQFNPGLTTNCSNLHDPNVMWGSTLCISAPGGAYNLTQHGNGTNNPWTIGDGYRYPAIPPPAGATVAEGTTLRCGAWYTHTDQETTCGDICLGNSITLPLFLAVNPSLFNATCSDDLVLGSTYCAGPVYNWNYTSAANATTTTTTTTTSSTTPSPTATCNGGTGDGGYLGLCDFGCYYGTCPPPCTCTSTGTPNPAPPLIEEHCWGRHDLPTDFDPLCEFACSHDYTPRPDVCTDVPRPSGTTSSSTSSSSSSSPTPTGTACVSGTGTGDPGHDGLCSFACHRDYCPEGPCVCTGWGELVPPPPATGVVCVPASGLDASYLGLCSYACNYGYQPEVCVVVP